MLRDPNLIPLSRQHHDGLALCVLTRRALLADASPANVAKLAQQAVDSFDLELAGHFTIEEDLLFPAIAADLGDLPLLAQLISEHAEMRRVIADLRTAPSALLLEQFCALLNDHIRREENELFQLAQSSLPDGVLRSLGPEIEAQAARICLTSE